MEFLVYLWKVWSFYTNYLVLFWKKRRLILHKKLFRWIKCLSSDLHRSNITPILFYIHLPEVSMFPHSFNLNVVILSSSWNSWYAFIWWFSSGLFSGWSYPTQPCRKFPTISILVLSGNSILVLGTLVLVTLSRVFQRLKEVLFSFFMPV